MLIGTVRLYKNDLNELHLFTFINKVMHVKIGEEWLIVEIYDEETKRFKMVISDNL